MNIIRLKAFIDAAQTLNFSTTAQHLHVAQSTVSKYIRDLEHTLGVHLFDRASTGLRLTEAGETILPIARRVARECSDLEDLAKSMDSDVVGHLNIACTTAAGKYILPQLAVRFCRLHPQVQISILSCTQENALERLLEEEADLGVVSVESGSDRLDCQYFFTDHILLIAPANHPWAERQFIEPAELLDQPILLREPTSGTRRALFTELAGHDITPDDLNIILEVGNAEAIVAAVGTGIGVSFVSRMAAAYALAFECVVEIPVLGFDLRRKICMARRIINNPNRTRDAFWSFIHDPGNDDLYNLASM